MTRIFLTAASALALANTPASGQEKDEAPKDWAAMATGDVQVAFDTYVANHPGWIDPTNPAFRAQLEMARDKAMALAQDADSPGDFTKAISTFSAVLADGHAKLAPYSMGDAYGKQTLLWPGFVAAWRGKDALIHDASGFDLPRGTRIVACDGVPAKRWIAEQGLGIGMRPSVPGHYYDFAPRTFAQMDTIDPIARSCDFIAPDGTTHSRDLDWVEAPDDFYARMALAAHGDPLDVGLTEPAPGIHWIALPDFSPDDEDAARYETLFADIAARRDTLKEARAVVLDLRGNGGGSSSWSRSTAEALWGKDAVTRRMADYFADTSVWHRASEGNIQYLVDIQAELQGRPQILAFVKELHAKMAAAHEKGEDFYVEPFTEPEEREEAAALSPVTDFTTPVYVIVHGRCGSACLDAIDTFTRFSNTTLVGAPSSSDTTYMEVRRVELPSKHAAMIIPIKFWHNRPRESGEAYQPAIRMDGLDFTTEAFLKLIEEQVD